MLFQGVLIGMAPFGVLAGRHGWVGVAPLLGSEEAKMWKESQRGTLTVLTCWKGKRNSIQAQMAWKMMAFEIETKIDVCVCICESKKMGKRTHGTAKKESRPARGTRSQDCLGLGQGKKVSQQGLLACWRGQHLGLLRSQDTEKGEASEQGRVWHRSQNGNKESQ